MSYKMKSTLYFIGFLAAVTMYYSMEYSPRLSEQLSDKTEIAAVSQQTTQTTSVATN